MICLGNEVLPFSILHSFGLVTVSKMAPHSYYHIRRSIDPCEMIVNGDGKLQQASTCILFGNPVAIAVFIWNDTISNSHRF